VTESIERGFPQALILWPNVSSFLYIWAPPASIAWKTHWVESCRYKAVPAPSPSQGMWLPSLLKCRAWTRYHVKKGYTYRSGPWDCAWPSVIFDLRKSITSREEGPTSTLCDWVSSPVKKSVTVDRNAICWSVDSCLPAVSVLVCVCSNRNLFFLYREMQSKSKFAYPGSLYKCCYISRATLRYFLHHQGMLYQLSWGRDHLNKSRTPKWLIKEHRIMNHLTNQCVHQRYRRCFCTCPAHYRSHWNGYYMYAKLLSQAGRKKSVYFFRLCWSALTICWLACKHLGILVCDLPERYEKLKIDFSSTLLSLLSYLKV